MCREETAFLEDFRELDVDKARELLEGFTADPGPLIELKGRSIARAVKNHLFAGEKPNPTLLADTNESTYPGRLTKGFLEYFDVLTISELPTATVLESLTIELEPVAKRTDMTTEEKTYHEDHISMPAVRVHYLTASETA